MEYAIVIAWDAEQRVYRVVASEIEDMWLAAPKKEDLIAALSEAATRFVKQTGAGQGAVRIYEEEALDPAA